jgi:hypothetical protein
MKHEHQNRHAVLPSLDPTMLDWLLTMMYNINPYHSYDILGARMLWKPKEARILTNFNKF